uniref:Uncharacterized protein n=1 Tax=Musa acuminata subsp. malaccensis TaxID=214687 RepID=A0A804JJ10_MUSAM|nr:PREDICTED: uncharacterized protein LOC103988637 [Musa acuminata subsp. malaccensis]XP_009405499.1 PREDICTED: uncharacterized protein LOC103988637 [Musa acuminata subsp. malaccensis]
MAETLISSEESRMEPVDLEDFRSRLKVVSEMQMRLFGSSDASSVDTNKLDDCSSDLQEMFKRSEAEEQNIASLGIDDLESYMEQLKKEICSAEEENTNISSEVETLTRMVTGDLVQLDGDLEALTCSLKFFDSQGLHHLSSSCPDNILLHRESHECPLHMLNENKFEILDLNQRIERSKENINILQDLDHALKRLEAVGHLEHMFSDARVIDFQGSCIRLSLKTPIPNIDGFISQHNLDFVEPFVSEHEMLIEVIDKTMELKSVEIFPDDVFIDGVVDTIKSSRDFISSTTSSLGWFIRQVQHRIVLCMLRRLLVKDANKSRHSLEYSDRDDTVTAHLVGGIDTFIKLAHGWPISSYPLKLLSIKNRDHQSKGISLSFLCKVKEMANSLDMQSRLHLARFVDAIEEILLQEMQSELHSNSMTA